MPPGVNWDLWIGPREMRPYHPSYTPVAWRDYWAFGNGTLGDFGCHDFDAPFWALELGAPISVEGWPAGHTDAEVQPFGEICYYRFGAHGDRPPVTLTWYGGGLRPPRPEGMPAGGPMPGRGVLFVGDKGVMLCGGAGGDPRLLPEEKMKAYRKPSPTLPRSKGHHRDWLDACKGGPPAGSNFAYGARLTETVLLGVLALRTGKKLDWDASAMKVNNAPEADPIIKESYRKGWEIPD